MKDKDISSLLSVLIPDRLQKPSDPQSDDKQTNDERRFKHFPRNCKYRMHRRILSENTRNATLS